MDLSPNQMLRLAPNKVDYLIPGGEMINEFLGEGPGARVALAASCPVCCRCSPVLLEAQPAQGSDP